MIIPDSPDYQRASVAADQLLGEGSFTGPFPFLIAANTQAIWIFGEGGIDPLPTVIGQQSHYAYPTFWAPWQPQAQVNWFSCVAIVTGQIDSEVMITVPSAASSHWWVVADTGGRFTLDLSLASALSEAGLPTPASALLVAGTDGTDLRPLLTDATGRLVVTGSTFPPVYGAPGAVLPADGLSVGGTDGTDLRILLLDAAGHQLTIDQNLKNAIAAPGAANPADAVVIAGTDGTDARTLLTDATGKLQVTTATFPPVFAAPGAVVPADALQVAGSDGTDLRALLTDSSGRPLTIDQNLKLAIAALAAAVPADAVLVGGSDGANLRALLLDASGHQLTIDQNLKTAITTPAAVNPAGLVVVGGTDGTDARALLTDATGKLQITGSTFPPAYAAPGAALPADALSIGGTDGTDLRALRMNAQGIPYTIPVVPSTAAGDHPPNDPLFTSAAFTTNANLLPVAGAGKRYRVFAVSIIPQSGTWTGYLFDTVFAVGVAVGSSAFFTPYVFPGAGVPCGNNAALEWVFGAGSGNAAVFIIYTLETI